jgi:hypothetical protein
VLAESWVADPAERAACKYVMLEDGIEVLMPSGSTWTARDVCNPYQLTLTPEEEALVQEFNPNSVVNSRRMPQASVPINTSTDPNVLKQQQQQ